MTTIPASQFVSVTPGVLGAGGNAIDTIGLLLTNSGRVPIGAIQSFAVAADVAAYFGPSSTEYALSEIYFNGFDNSYVKPASVKFAQYNTTAVAAYLRGDTVTLSLTQLKALPVGTIVLTIDGATATAASVDLSGSTSFSDAAVRIQAAFPITGTAATGASNTISGTVMTLGGAITGNWAAGQTVTGTSVTTGTYITSFASGTPNTDGATYNLSVASTVSVGEAMHGDVVPLVTYDSILSAFVFTSVLSGAQATITYATTSAMATSLNLTQATGAVISQGAALQSDPNAFMTNIVTLSQDWTTFMTTFDPDVSGHTNKLAFATWAGLQNNRYAFACWDVDTAPSATLPAVSSLGYALQQGNISGTCLIGGDGTNAVTASYAAFVCGYGASLDFNRTNGRTTLAFRSQSGLLATCSTASTMNNLIGNGYNFYGVTATANQQFIWFYPGSISGEFLWMDSYIDEIYMNSQFQLDGMELFANTPSIPYNTQGYSMIEAAFLDTIFQMLNFGAIRAGVTLSLAQIAEVNSQAGLNIAPVLNQRGWYVQVSDASPQVRAARQSPPCTFWYMDGQSVQQIDLFSEELV